MGKKYKIYLSGGMTGLTEEEMKTWRLEVKNSIYATESKANFFDPTEQYEYVYHYLPLKHEAEEFQMKFDIRNLVDSDLVVCNVSSNPQSVGTNIELGIAYNLHIPIIIYNPSKIELHPWHESIADYKTEDMETLIEIIEEYYLLWQSNLEA